MSKEETKESEDLNEETKESIGLSEAKTKYCSECGKKISDKATMCPHCGAKIPSTEEKKKVKETKSPGLAAVLSFLIPGLGQIYNGQILKGFLFILVSLFAFILIFLIIGIFLYPLIWIIGIYDAYHEAEKSNQ